MKLFYKYMAIFFIFFTHNISRLVVDEDNNGKFRLERVNPVYCLLENKQLNRVSWSNTLPVLNRPQNDYLNWVCLPIYQGKFPPV